MFADPGKYFSAASIQKIAQKTDGLAGHELFNLVNAIYAADAALPEGQSLSKTKLNQIVDSFEKQSRLTPKIPQSAAPASISFARNGRAAGG